MNSMYESIATLQPLHVEIPMEDDAYETSDFESITCSELLYSEEDCESDDDHFVFESINDEGELVKIKYAPFSPSPITSINTGTTASTVQLPNSKVIKGIEDFPEIVIDNLDLDIVPNQHFPLQFFVTKCTPEILSPLFTGEFLDTLWYSPTWKLYVPEMIYGFISYAINSQRNPFTGSICTETAPGFIAQLHQYGKIVVIKKDEIVDVHLNEYNICDTDCVCVQVTCTHYGVLSHALNFSIHKTDRTTTVSSACIGTLIYHDLMLGGRYPTHPSEKGFPLKDIMAHTTEEGEKTFYKVFEDRLQQLKDLILTYPRTHYAIQFNDTDKLVDLWYMKHLSDQFNTKIHVTPLYQQFVMQYVPQFADCFSPSNMYGTCRFHYDCAQTNDVESCLSRRAFNAYKINPGSMKVNTIWIGCKALVPDDVSLFFIHEGDEYSKLLDKCSDSTKC